MMHCRIPMIGIGLLAMSSSVAAETAQLTPDEIRLITTLKAKLDASPNPGKRDQALRMLGSAGTVAVSRSQSAVPAVSPGAAKVTVPRANVTIFNKNTPQVRNAAEVEIEKRRAEAPDGTSRQFSPCAGLTFLLRQDWKDIGILGCPATTDKAAGAEVSYSNDRVARNGLFTARGTAAMYFSSLVDIPAVPSAPNYQAFGAYVTMNRAINSSAALAKSDSDKMAFGGVVEFGFQTFGGANYFRLRGGAVEDRLKNTGAVNLTAEFMPVYDDGTIHLTSPFRPLGAPFYVSVEPVFLVQYAAVTGNGQVLDFNGLPHALRIGPQLTVKAFPLYDATGLWARLSGSATYHWAYETYSQRGISWFQTSITYNIDDAGQFGITGSYKKGRDEDTGTQTDIYKVALTGKI
jgi:hypothetical protein